MEQLKNNNNYEWHGGLVKSDGIVNRSRETGFCGLTDWGVHIQCTSPKL